MPQKVLFGKEEFLEELRPQMLSLGFRETNHKEFIFDAERLGLVAPRQRPGSQTGFMFYAMGLKVQVWSTYVPSIEQAKESVNGWVMIKKHDDVMYFAPPLRRTENFFERIVKRAKACKERIENRPICKICRRGMDIVPGPAFGSYYWKCMFLNCRWKDHQEKNPRESFDYGLSKESLEFLKKDRGVREQYRELVDFYKLFLEGPDIPYVPARARRKKWRMERPGNKD